MIIKIEANKRHYADHGWLKTFWLFSFSNYYDAENMEFGSLRVFNDDIVMPNGGFPDHPHEDMEIVTIILSGKLTHKDSMGNEAVISAGEIQRMSAGTGVVHSEFNRHKEPVHLYQLWFYPNQHTQTGYEQKKADLHKNGLTLFASKNIEEKSILLKADANIWKLNLSKGEKYKYTLSKNKGLFVYITEGNLSINKNEYGEGDQARIQDEKEVFLSTKDNVSALMIEVDI